MHPMLNIAITASRSASKIILRFLDHLDTVEVGSKDRNDFVTQVDRLAEEEVNILRGILSAIHRRF